MYIMYIFSDLSAIYYKCYGSDNDTKLTKLCYTDRKKATKFTNLYHKYLVPFCHNFSV